MDSVFAPTDEEQSGTAPHSSPAGYAFLNHSTNALPHDLPSNTESQPSSRQKRKRTSAEDQNVLETAYKRDPKPDKAARQEIVKSVALGEKEVQIWFQNRRQSSRRKARPLLPHEVAQYQASRAAAPSTPSEPGYPGANFGSDDSNATIPDESLLEGEAGDGDAQPQHLAPLISAPSTVRRIQDHAVPPGQLSREGRTALAALQAFRSDASGQSSALSFSPGPVASLGYLANKRRASSFKDTKQTANVSSEQDHAVGTESSRRLRKSTSFVRLSMTTEGAAKIVTKDSSSPSPHRPSQSVQQTYSAGQGSGLSTLDLTRSPAEPVAQTLRRSASGRSRDSRAWEFWCDKDSRNELEEKAEKDASGSAADAIGLMRANSGRRVLGTLTGKRNSLLTRQPPAKRTKHDHPRPALQRANTSNGHLQQGRTEAGMLKHTPKLKYSDSAASISIPSNDSDKENWTPDRDFISTSRPAATTAPPAHREGRVLGESRVAGNAMRQPRLGNSPRKPAVVPAGQSENTDPELDPELAAFMVRDRKSNSISEDEELDCVQGLLSLSQGNWR